MKGYNVRVTSLEEVFNKLGEEEMVNSKEEDASSIPDIPEDNIRIEPRKISKSEQFCAVFKMRSFLNVRTC
jgi:hypothetical protein